MATKTQGKGTVVALAEKLIAGTNKHLANTAQVMLIGGSFTPTQITAQLQALVNLRNDVDAAKASAKAKLAVEKADMPGGPGDPVPPTSPSWRALQGRP